MAIIDNVTYINDQNPVAVHDLGGGNTSNSSAATLTFGANYIPAGSLIAVAVVEQSATASGTLSDGGSNTYAVAAGGALGASAGFATIFYTYNSVALTNATFTYTKQQGAVLKTVSMVALWATGVQTSSDPLDAPFTATASGTTSTPSVTSGAAAQANELVLALTAWSNATALALSSQTGFSTPFNTSGVQVTSQQTGGWQIASTTDAVTYAPVITATPTGNATLLVAFKTVGTFGGWRSVAPWAPSTSYSVGAIVRQRKSPAVTAERCFVCGLAGTSSAAGSEPAWGTGRGSKTTDNTVNWYECSGVAALNGDQTNTITWATLKATGSVTLGQIIQRNNGASYQICTAAGTLGASEPAFSNTVGATTVDSGTTWTSLGPVANYSAWGAPYAKLHGDFLSQQSGGIKHFVRDTHSEFYTTTFTNGISAGGNSASKFDQILCVTGTNVPPVLPTDISSGAIIRGTGSTIYTFGRGGGLDSTYYYIEGMSFYAATGSQSANLNFAVGWIYLKNCTLGVAGLFNTGRINFTNNQLASGANKVILDNPKFYFSLVGSSLAFSGQDVEWWNYGGSPLAAGSLVPTSLFNAATVTSNFTITAVDLSAFGAGKSFVLGGATGANKIKLIGCLLGASVSTFGSANTVADGTILDIIGCNTAGSTNIERNERHAAQGDITTEATIIRSSGSTDGTTAYSLKTVTSTNITRFSPLVIAEGEDWNTLTGSAKTLTFHCLTDNVTLQDGELFLEVDYLGSATSTMRTRISSAPATMFTSMSNLTSDSTSAWTTTGLSVPVAQQFSVTFTPQMIGSFVWRLKITKASVTVYVDLNPEFA